MRMLAIVILGLVCLAAPADAACDLAIDAPDEIADAVAVWSAAQRSCEAGFTAIATTEADGIHLTATDTHHRWTRLVRDARTAAALITSWAMPEEQVTMHSLSTLVDHDASPRAVLAPPITGALGVLVVGTSNMSETSTREVGAGLAASVEVGRAWWRVGGALVFVRDRTDSYARSVPSIRIAARHLIGRVDLEYRLGVGEQYARTPDTSEWTTVVEVGAFLRLGLADHFAVRLDASVFAPARSFVESRQWAPVLGLGAEVSL